MKRDLHRSNEIENRAKRNAENYLKAERDLLASLIEVEEDRTFELHGITYLTPYCVKVLNLDETIAKCMVRIVRKSHHVPELAQSVINGKVSLFKAKAIASVITPENKEEWLKKATTLSKEKLEREVSSANGVETVNVNLKMTHEAYDRLIRMRDVYSSKTQAFASFEDTIDWSIKESIYKHDPIEKAERSRGHSVKHEVTKAYKERCAWIHEDGSQCEERKWLQTHHIIHRKDGGPDTIENLITLCASHHRMIHREH